MKIHLHSEQFDGYRHAVCGAGDWDATSLRCVEADVFEQLPRIKRCLRCTYYWWPKGGDPE